MAYNRGIPSAVLFAGPQKHTAIVSSGVMRVKMCRMPNLLTASTSGGRERKKHTAVRAMYRAMLKKTTNRILCTERV
jgi:hypothetical protein